MELGEWPLFLLSYTSRKTGTMDHQAAATTAYCATHGMKTVTYTLYIYSHE